MTTLAPECVRIQFRYRRSQRVRFTDGDPRRARAYTVVQQRYTRRDVLCALYEYLLASPEIPHSFWANEADLEPVLEETP